MDSRLTNIEELILKQLIGKFVEVTDEEQRREIIKKTARDISSSLSPADIEEIINDINDLKPISDFLNAQNVEDIMVNNTKNVFIYDSKKGFGKLSSRFNSKEELNKFVDKLKLYMTNWSSNGNIMDIHMPSGSRANIVESPLGYDITIRNFRREPLSIIDLINNNTIDYNIAARLWLYTDGFRVKPANILIGGIPASGKTTMLNSLFSFFRPDKRIVTIEETYELNSSTHDNTVRLETSNNMEMIDLVKNALRMRPDIIIIGEVRGAEANDMITAMNIGKISMGTIHASSSRDIITRLEHSPMNVPRDVLNVIDVLMVISMVYKKGIPSRKVVQISEVSGMEGTQTLISDLYKYDYKTNSASPILPSVTYRDALAKVIGVPPTDILAEEVVRARIIEQLNKHGIRDMKSISEAVMEYYSDPEHLLQKLGLANLTPIIKL
ncbi:MAG: Flp pilus assembly complex ATPase component TadA [Candidatus Marsarchaeota archaeon]|nr:Flp pilus assembly complex ATPase component TadA [Candidatus Marsarchaeota archaeon]